MDCIPSAVPIEILSLIPPTSCTLELSLYLNARPLVMLYRAGCMKSRNTCLTYLALPLLIHRYSLFERIQPRFTYLSKMKDSPKISLSSLLAPSDAAWCERNNFDILDYMVRSAKNSVCKTMLHVGCSTSHPGIYCMHLHYQSNTTTLCRGTGRT